MRALAGRLAAGILGFLGRLPPGLVLACGTALLPLYAPFRLRTRRTLRNLNPSIGLFEYYRMRLRLALLSLRHMLNKPDGLTRTIHGESFYQAALASGKPVVLVGWHQGPVELLHKIPAEAAPDRPFYVVTAGAFAPALSDLMHAGRTTRSGPDKIILTPGDRNGLRDWARGRGVLALMIDQVPGHVDAWLETCEGSVRLPWPARLIEWLRERDAIWLTVKVGMPNDHEVRFQYDVLNEQGRRGEIGALVSRSLVESPKSYNWSYGKVVVTT